MKLVIGVVGEIGSGKGTFAEFLRDIATDKKVVRIASSDILRETLSIWDIPATRRALQDLAIIMNGHYGDGTLAHAVEKRIADTDADIIVFDGMRWLSDEVMLRTLPNTVLVYVTANLEIRYERIKKRSEKVGESSITLEQFKDAAKIRTELEIAEIGGRANVKIVNNGTVEEYRQQVEKFYRELTNSSK